MNDLSWIIYLADVCDNLDYFFFWIMFFGIVGLVFWGIMGFCMTDDTATPDEWRVWRRVGTWMIAPALIGGVIFGSIIPAKETLYAIAASELGEEIVRSPTAGKAVQALNAWLERQIDGEAPATDKDENKNTD